MTSKSLTKTPAKTPAKTPGRRGSRITGSAAFLLLALVLTLLFSACVSEVKRGTPEPNGTPSAGTTPSAPNTPVQTAEPAGTDELFLEVRAPIDGSTVPGIAVGVHGLTARGARVSVNGASATVDRNGGFNSEARLSPGVNTVEVQASNSAGNRESVSLTVTSLALPKQPFLLLVTEPVNQSVVFDPDLRLTGRTGPDAVASVNGVSVEVDPFGGFTTKVALKPGPNIIDVVATNNDGRVLSAVVAVIYRDAG